jgi:predicted aconitase with swiveling domain
MAVGVHGSSLMRIFTFLGVGVSGSCVGSGVMLLQQGCGQPVGMLPLPCLLLEGLLPQVKWAVCDAPVCCVVDCATATTDRAVCCCRHTWKQLDIITFTFLGVVVPGSCVGSAVVCSSRDVQPAAMPLPLNPCLLLKGLLPQVGSVLVQLCLVTCAVACTEPYVATGILESSLTSLSSCSVAGL